MASSKLDHHHQVLLLFPGKHKLRSLNVQLAHSSITEMIQPVSFPFQKDSASMFGLCDGLSRSRYSVLLQSPWSVLSPHSMVFQTRRITNVSGKEKPRNIRDFFFKSIINLSSFLGYCKQSSLPSIRIQVPQSTLCSTFEAKTGLIWGGEGKGKK